MSHVLRKLHELYTTGTGTAYMYKHAPVDLLSRQDLFASPAVFLSYCGFGNWGKSPAARLP